MYFFKNTTGNWVLGSETTSFTSKIPCTLRRDTPTVVTIMTIEKIPVLLIDKTEVTTIKKNEAGDLYTSYAEFLTAVSDFFDNAPITAEEVDVKIGAEVETLSDRIDTVEGIANASASGSLGSIKPTDAAPTPARNGNYTFSIGGNKPAWLTAEAGITTVKAGDGVAVVYIAPSTYSYTHVDVSSAFVTMQKLAELGYIFKGVATPSTNPGTPDGPQFYIASQKGTYSNFGGVVLGRNRMVVFKYVSEAWVTTEIATNLAKTEDLKELRLIYAKRSHGKNLVDPNDKDIAQGSYIDLAGNIATNLGYWVTGFIPISSGQTLCKSTSYGGSAYSVYYDSEFNKIGTAINTQTIPYYSGASYIRTTFGTSVTNPQVEIGNTYTGYSPFTDIAGKVNSEALQSDSVTTTKIADKNITPEKASFFENRPYNMYNPADPGVVTGYYMGTSGLPNVGNASYKTTGFMEVREGDKIYGGNNGTSVGLRFLYGFDANKNKVDGSEDTGRTSYTVPAGVAYVRVSFTYLTYTLYQVQRNAITEYIAYEERVRLKEKYAPPVSDIPNGIVTTDKIAENAVSSSKIADGSISENKTIFFDRSINIFNPNDVDVQLGYYILYSAGWAQVNAGYNATGYIPVTPGSDYTLSYKNQIAWYNSSKIYISGSNSTDTNKTQTAPAGAAYLRCSVKLANWDTFQVELGSSQSGYVPYGFRLKEDYISKYFDELGFDQFETQLGNAGKQVYQASLTDGNAITITDFPYHLKKGLSMSVKAKFASLLGSIAFGKGIGQYRGDWIEIDGTNIYWKHYESSESTNGTVAHGLTIDTFISATLYVDDSAVAYVILQTLVGYFTTTFQWTYEANFSPFINTVGQDLTDVKINCTSKEFQHPVWAFGDSYFGVGANRWPGVMKTFGFFNFLLNGLAGQGSSGAYSDLQRCLNYGTPKYILWCLGMNDSDAGFQSVLINLISLCETKGITLILSTIPTVPARDKETITAVVEASGYRYIDFYEAVGANSSGAWYTGYLASDEVHPNAVGAEALAMQVLIDFPELMQYGLTPTTSEVGGITGDN